MKLFILVVALFWLTGMLVVQGAPTMDTAILQHEDVSNLWLSRNGKIVVSESDVWWRRRVKIWAMAEGKIIETLAASPVRALSADGRYLIYGDDPCYLHDIGSGTEDKKLSEGISSEPLLAVTLCGARILLLYPDAIETRDLGGQVLKRVALHVIRTRGGRQDPVVGALAADGRAAALWNIDTFLHSHIVLFDAFHGTVIKTLPESGSSGEGCSMALDGCNLNNSLSFSPDGRFITGTSYGLTDPGLDENVHAEEVTDRRFWEVASGKTVLHWNSTIAAWPPFSPDGKAVLYQADQWSEGDNTGTVTANGFSGIFEFRDIRTNRHAAFQIPRPDKRKNGFYLVRLSGDGRVMASFDRDGMIRVQSLSAQSAQKLLVPKVPVPKVLGAATR